MSDPTLQDEARQIAGRFHEHHEWLFAKAKGREPMPFEDMPDSYTGRLVTTFEQLLRDGSLHAGPRLGHYTCVRKPGRQ
jgi:hypothetical protein